MLRRCLLIPENRRYFKKSIKIFRNEHHLFISESNNYASWFGPEEKNWMGSVVNELFIRYVQLKHLGMHPEKLNEKNFYEMVPSFRQWILAEVEIIDKLHEHYTASCGVDVTIRDVIVCIHSFID